MNILPTVARLSLLALSLVACGGGSSPPTPQPTDPLLTETNAWKDAVPADAEIVSVDDFRKALASGDAVLVSSASLAAQKAAREQQYQSDLAYLSGLSDKGPYVQRLLKAAASVPNANGDRSASGGRGVLLLGLAQQLRGAVEAYQRSQDPTNALTAYTTSYNLLSDVLKAQADTPDSLKGASLVQIAAAATKLNDLLGSVPNLDHTLPDTGITGSALRGGGSIGAQAVSPGNGTDNSGPCTPSGLVKSYWFPLKNFVSPIKNQAGRGTCWAFAAVGALESRERVQNGAAPDLSEQFLVNKVKQDWDSSDDTDGYWSDRALQTAADKGQVFPSEGAWTYNPAGARPYPKYDNTCYLDNHMDAQGRLDHPYNGTCSETAHESRRTCTTFVFTFCSYVKVTYSGAGVGSSGTTLRWSSGTPFNLNLYRDLLAQGYTLLADFPVYKGFDEASGAGGLVSNYTTDTSDGKDAGGHAVQFVGFLSNDTLSKYGQVSKVGGGGYFILKNSWGCVGDGGYYYVPAD